MIHLRGILFAELHINGRFNHLRINWFNYFFSGYSFDR